MHALFVFRSAELSDIVNERDATYSAWHAVKHMCTFSIESHCVLPSVLVMTE